MDAREASILYYDACGGLGRFQQRCVLTAKLSDERLQLAYFQMGRVQCVPSQEESEALG